MREPILTKPQMYGLLDSGRLGNTLPSWAGRAGANRWLTDPDTEKYPYWGVRAVHTGQVASDNRTRLDIPTAEVLPYLADKFPAGDFHLSPYIGHFATFVGQVTYPDHEPFGLYLEGGPLDWGWKGNWRHYFNHCARHWEKSAAHAVLRHYLWPEDYDNLMDLLREYPGHVVEFTAADRAVGLIPNRNTIIWEVRRY